MKIAVTRPTKFQEIDEALAAKVPAVEFEIYGALVSIHVQGESLEERLAIIRETEATLAQAIADADNAEEIEKLGQMKSLVIEIERHLRRESSYSSRANESAEATNDVDESQLHAKQHTSTDDSSEQHGAAPHDEEIEIEQAEQEKSGFTGFFGQRARADGR
jgi:hypothetical protein